MDVSLIVWVFTVLLPVVAVVISVIALPWGLLVIPKIGTPDAPQGMQTFGGPQPTAEQIATLRTQLTVVWLVIWGAVALGAVVLWRVGSAHWRRVESRHNLRVGAYQAAKSRWDALHYCAKCDLVFDPRNPNTVAPSTEASRLVWP